MFKVCLWYGSRFKDLKYLKGSPKAEQSIRPALCNCGTVLQQYFGPLHCTSNLVIGGHKCNRLVIGGHKCRPFMASFVRFPARVAD